MKSHMTQNYLFFTKPRVSPLDLRLVKSQKRLTVALRRIRCQSLGSSTGEITTLLAPTVAYSNRVSPLDLRLVKSQRSLNEFFKGEAVSVPWIFDW